MFTWQKWFHPLSKARKLVDGQDSAIDSSFSQKFLQMSQIQATCLVLVFLTKKKQKRPLMRMLFTLLRLRVCQLPVLERWRSSVASKRRRPFPEGSLPFTKQVYRFLGESWMENRTPVWTIFWFWYFSWFCLLLG